MYSFTENRAKDTVMIAIMLTQKQTELIPNWKCQELDVDTYKPKHTHSFSKNFPQFFIFNCNKKRFKNIDDPD